MISANSLNVYWTIPRTWPIDLMVLIILSKCRGMRFVLQHIWLFVSIHRHHLEVMHVKYYFNTCNSFKPWHVRCIVVITFHPVIRSINDYYYFTRTWSNSYLRIVNIEKGRFTSRVIVWSETSTALALKMFPMSSTSLRATALAAIFININSRSANGKFVRSWTWTSHQ